MADEVFHDVCYKAGTREDVIAGIDEFLDKVKFITSQVALKASLMMRLLKVYSICEYVHVTLIEIVVVLLLF